MALLPRLCAFFTVGTRQALSVFHDNMLPKSGRKAHATATWTVSLKVSGIGGMQENPRFLGFFQIGQTCGQIPTETLMLL